MYDKGGLITSTTVIYLLFMKIFLVCISMAIFIGPLPRNFAICISTIQVWPYDLVDFHATRSLGHSDLSVRFLSFGVCIFCIQAWNPDLSPEFFLLNCQSLFLRCIPFIMTQENIFDVRRHKHVSRAILSNSHSIFCCLILVLEYLIITHFAQICDLNR